MDPLTTVSLLKSRRTKIIATLGPASEAPETLSALVRAGVNVFRFNMSHGSLEDHARMFAAAREAARAAGLPVATMVDLSGPKIRTGAFEGGSLPVEKGQSVTVTTRPVKGGPGLISSQYGGLGDDVEPGDTILLDDGNVALRVGSVKGTEIACTVERSGVLRDRTGMLMPGARISLPALTGKDLGDLAFALEMGVDILALSFVRDSGGVEDLKARIAAAGRTTPVIAKIETAAALTEIDAILAVTDGIMVARGDLGVEVELERVPILQEELVEKARLANKPVIVATQMLESMVNNARPTRAEVADIANVVMDGADAMLLSRETAIGNHPVLAVETMDRVARHTEGWLWTEGAFGSMVSGEPLEPPVPFGEALAGAVADLSRDLLASCIIVPTRSGHSAALAASARPAAAILALTLDDEVWRQMSLLWGVIPLLIEEERPEDTEALALRLVRELELAEEGDHVLLVSRYHRDPGQSVPTVAVLTL